jgi:hypothetical protein
MPVSHIISVRVSNDELIRLKKEARALNINLSALLRECLKLNTTPQHKKTRKAFKKIIPKPENDYRY